MCVKRHFELMTLDQHSRVAFANRPTTSGLNPARNRKHNSKPEKSFDAGIAFVFNLLCSVFLEVNFIAELLQFFCSLLIF